MKRLTIAKVVSELTSLVSSDVIYLLLFLIFLLLAFYFIFSNKINKKEKRIIKIVYIIIFVCLIINYSSSFISFLDYLVNKIFLAIYFPNLAVYVIMVLTSTIIFINSLFSQKMNRTIRNVNIGVYMLLLYFLFLLGQVVINKNINVYSDLAIYQNEEMMVLIEVTMILFSLWIIGLSIYKTVTWIISKKTKKVVKNNFIKESNVVNQEVLMDGFTKEEYQLLRQYLKEMKEREK